MEGEGSWLVGEWKELCNQFWWEYPKERKLLKDLDVDENVKLKLILKKRTKGRGLDTLAQEADKYGVAVNAVTNRRVPQNAGTSWPAVEIYSVVRSYWHLLILIIEANTLHYFTTLFWYTP
jgi:hypothetical protein